MYKVSMFRKQEFEKKVCFINLSIRKINYNETNNILVAYL